MQKAQSGLKGHQSCQAIKIFDILKIKTQKSELILVDKQWDTIPDSHNDQQALRRKKKKIKEKRNFHPGCRSRRKCVRCEGKLAENDESNTFAQP